MKTYLKKQLLSIIFILMYVFNTTISLFEVRAIDTVNKIHTSSIESVEGTTTVVNTTDTLLRFDVTEEGFGANGNDKNDDREAIQRALNKAKEEIINRRDRTIEVHIPRGTYYISDILYIYSNTRLILDKDTIIIAGMEKNQFANDVIKAKHLNSKNQKCETRFCPHEGYTQWKNITIEGGIWDCNNADDSSKEMIGAFLFRHGEGLILKNLTIKNSSGHTVNVSATKNVLISGVTIKDTRKSNKKGFLTESIHIDSAGIGEKQAYPVDGTPIKNLTIQNCTFDNVYTAIGSHSIYRTAKGDTLSSNIKIINNTFKNIKYYAIIAISFENITIKGNVAVGKNVDNYGEKAYAFLYTRNCTGSNVNISNTIIGGANIVNNFEYPIVEHNYKIKNFKSELNNKLCSNIETQTSFICVDYISNGGKEDIIRKTVNIITSKKQNRGFVLPNNIFTKVGYKLKNWKVTLDTGEGEKYVGTFNPGQYISTNNLNWHHSTYKVYAEWIKA